VRGLGVGLAYSLYWTLSFASSQTLETLFSVIGHSATFALYACTTCLALLFSCLVVPETRGVSLEVIPCTAAVGALSRIVACETTAATSCTALQSLEHEGAEQQSEKGHKEGQSPHPQPAHALEPVAP
jgi:H+/Cl- antiporter ClcA